MYTKTRHNLRRFQSKYFIRKKLFIVDIKNIGYKHFANVPTHIGGGLLYRVFKTSTLLDTFLLLQMLHQSIFQIMTYPLVVNYFLTINQNSLFHPSGTPKQQGVHLTILQMYLHIIQVFPGRFFRLCSKKHSSMCFGCASGVLSTMVNE